MPPSMGRRLLISYDFGGSGLRALTFTWQPTHAAKKHALETECYASHRPGAFFPLKPWGDGSCSSPWRGAPPTTIPFTERAPCFLNFSVGQCQILSLSLSLSTTTSYAISHLNIVAGCPKTPSAMIFHCFQAPRATESQIIGPLSRLL
jgi:hypothetical protein